MRRRRHSRRGSILILVLAVLAMLGILGATLSRSVYTRSLSAQASLKAQREASIKASAERLARMTLETDPRGGTLHVPRATIADGANGAPSNEGIHGSQTIPAGGDDRFRRGADR
jgi:type II secretory pathway pseudopilin PulG